MKLTLFSLTLFSLFLATSIVAATASANETTVVEGQQIVLWTQTTIGAIEAEIAKSTPLVEKIESVRALLAAEGNAADGFCETAVAIYAQEPKPKPEAILDACNYVIDDEDTLNAIASGEFSQAQDPQRPNLTLRDKLSQAVSASILLMAMGPF